MAQQAVLKIDTKAINTTVSDAIGEDVLPLLKLLRRKEHSEVILAEKLDQEVNTVRNILYRLHQHNLVRSERRRDEENGWYVYWWQFVPEGMQHLFKQHAERNLQALNKSLEQESKGSFYSCTSTCVRLEFEDAFSMEFRCPECGDLMHLKEQNQQRIDELKGQIEAINGLMS